ncbi:MAG: hypothetical protein AB7G13_14720 [Lautropia sp.]
MLPLPAPITSSATRRNASTSGDLSSVRRTTEISAVPASRRSGRKTTPRIGSSSIDAGTSQADAIVQSGTNLVTFPALQEIETRAGKPVVSSNQALPWSVLRKAGVEDALPLGRSFEAA